MLATTLLGLKSPVAAASSLPEVCALLAPAEIAVATDQVWGEGAINESLSAQGRTVCDWYTVSGEYAAVQVMIVNNAAVFEPSRDSAGEVFGLVQEEMSIAGADAVYATAEGSLIGMKVGELFVQVSYIPPGPGNVLSTTRKLAQTVVGRL